MSQHPSDEPWKICYAQLAPKLLLFARQWVASQADAEDVVQNAFIRFWRKRPDAGPEHYPLLYAAVRSTALDLLRADSRRARRETDEARQPWHDHDCWFDASLEQREEAEAIQAALERLPEEQREVLVLKIWSDFTFAQIADVLGASINTVASRYRYAIDALRRILKPAEYERI